MAKFRIKFKLQALELEVEGTRDDLPVIQQAITEQFSGLLQPATMLADGEVPKPVPPAFAGSTPAAVQAKATKRRGRSTGSSNNGNNSGDAAKVALDWQHDASKYGNPLPTWSTQQKAVWLLYILNAEASVPEATAKTLELTFNKHFRTSGQVTQANVGRDLAKLKTPRKNEPAWVSQDTTKTPAPFFLLENGTRGAQKLVAEALGGTTN